MKKIVLLNIIIIFCTHMTAQTTENIKLWPNGPAEDNQITQQETINERGILSTCKEAELTIYRPADKKSNGAAILICPGGGYQILAMKHEGHEYAKILNDMGFTAAVLKYRMPNGHYNIPLTDAQEAMRILRKKATDWGVKKIGVSGFSAGGHLAASLGMYNDSITRPDFMVLFYPVISTDESITHKGSRSNLLGSKAKDKELLLRFSLEKQVSNNTPPTLLFLSSDDQSVSPLNSTKLYEQMIEKKVTTAMYIFPVGKHGWGCNDSFPYKNDWIKLMSDWVKQTKIIK